MLAPLATACVRARPIQRWHAVALTSAIVLLELLPVALAHDDKGVEAGTEMKMGIAGSGRLAPASTHSDENPQSYFRLKEHSNVILAHIALMTMVWAFVLPVGEYLSERLARGIIDWECSCCIKCGALALSPTSTSGIPCIKCFWCAPGHRIQKADA